MATVVSLCLALLLDYVLVFHSLGHLSNLFINLSPPSPLSKLSLPQLPRKCVSVAVSSPPCVEHFMLESGQERPEPAVCSLKWSLPGRGQPARADMATQSVVFPPLKCPCPNLALQYLADILAFMKLLNRYIGPVCACGASE